MGLVSRGASQEWGHTEQLRVRCPWMGLVSREDQSGVGTHRTAQGGVSLDGAGLQRGQSGLGATHATAFWWRKSWKVLGFRGRGNRHSRIRIQGVGGLLSHR